MKSKIRAVLQGKEGLIKESIIAVFLRGCGGVCSVGAAAAAARVLGASEAGLFFIGFALLNVLSLLARVGLDKTVFRFVSNGHAKGNCAAIKGVIIQALGIVTCLSVAIGMLLIFLSDYIADVIFHSDSMSAILKMVGLAIPSVSLSSIMGEALQGIGKRFTSIYILFISQSGGMLVLVLMCLVLGFKVSSREAALILLFSCVITLISGAVILAKSFPVWSEMEFLPRENLMASCMPLCFVDIIAIASIWFSQLLVGAKLPASDVALYALAQRIAGLVVMLFGSLNIVVAPRIAYLFSEGDVEGLRLLSVRAMLVMFVLAVPLIMMLCFFSQDIMGIFGADFIGGANVLRIISVGIFFAAMNGVISYLLIMSGNEKDLRASMLFGGVIVLLLPVYMLPKFGLEGVVLGTVFGWFIQCLCSVMFIRSRLGFWVLPAIK